MPSVIFRVAGKLFNPEAALTKVTFKPYRVRHVGEMAWDWQIREDVSLGHSEFSVEIGPKKSHDLARQIKLAKAFVQKHFSEIKRIKGAEDMRLDFGYWPRLDNKRKPIAIQCDYFPPDFLQMCGELKIGIELSRYYVERT